jgi:thiol-disulfide isomerase/thioredoxin
MPFRRLAHRFLTPVLIGAALALASAHAQAVEKFKVGDFPPPKLGWRVKLSDYRGKVVVLSFWASWCPPCRKEIGALAALEKEATRSKVVVFVVDWREDQATYWRVEHILHGHGADLTLISDADDYIGKQYGIEAIPHMFVIGRDGRIAAIHVGYQASELPTIVQEINALWDTP